MTAVPKYTKNRNGVHTLNPLWRPETEPEVVLPPFQNQATALPVVSSAEQHKQYFPQEEEIVIAPSYQQAVGDYQIFAEAEIVVEGEEIESGKTILDQLNRVFAKYEVPAGMLSKLLLLKDFQIGEIIVDDSGSMQASTDAKGPKGEFITRWLEAKYTLMRMLEVLAYVPDAPVFYVRFLNRPNVLELKRQDAESHEAFSERARGELDTVFQSLPIGGTPALERIVETLSRYNGQRVLRYFLGDGVPNGGVPARRKIEQSLMYRVKPKDNPFTFISCTNEDSEVEWMKECEEIAPYCSEFDDFLDESREILKDQGKAFPYSFGLHLVGQLVAAFCPHDLDAMDESVPFTKETMDSLLGYQSSPEEYRYYFDCFLDAQRKLYGSGGYETKIQKNFANKLPKLFAQFQSAGLADDIPTVQEYKRALKANRQVQQQRRHEEYGVKAMHRGPAPSSPADDCCIIL